MTIIKLIEKYLKRIMVDYPEEDKIYLSLTQLVYDIQQLDNLKQLIKDKIYRETIIHHPNGDCTLGEIQKDVTAWNNISAEAKTSFGFTSKTVQALIDKIISLQLDTK